MAKSRNEVPRRRGMASGLIAVGSIVFGCWVGVVTARADLERRASHFMNGPPDCAAEEAAYAFAASTLLAADTNLGYAELDLFECQQNGGNCTTEALLVAAAESALAGAEAAYEAAEEDLDNCTNSSGKACPQGCDEPQEFDGTPVPIVADQPIEAERASEPVASRTQNAVFATVLGERE